MPNKFFPHETKNPSAVAAWLFLCCFLILCMILLGGYTRLTHSGLSMVNWSPIMGVWPPLNTQQWLDLFAQYRQFPEYRFVNHDMNLEGFKAIFWIEYAHRMLGRLIGIVFFLPFLVFLGTRKLTTGTAIRLSSIFLLGGLQGGMGWYMVKSGLINEPNVSQYRLAVHLFLAFVIYSMIFRTAMQMAARPAERVGSMTGTKSGSGYQLPFRLLMGSLLVLIISGGFMAGTRAGYIFNTFPRMGGEWIPAGLWSMQPAWKNIFENGITIQFTHRLLALMVFVFTCSFVLFVLSRFRTDVDVRRATLLTAGLLLVQLLLGVSTLVLRVPVAFGVAHQAGAVAFLSALLYLRYRLDRSKSIRAGF